MKVFLILLLVAIAAAETIHDGEIFDKFDILELMRADGSRREVFDCVLGLSPCGEFQVLKDKGPSVLRTKCKDCTPEQKAKFEEVIKELESEHFDEFKEVRARLAPSTTI